MGEMKLRIETDTHCPLQQGQDAQHFEKIRSEYA